VIEDPVGSCGKIGDERQAARAFKSRKRRVNQEYILPVSYQQIIYNKYKRQGGVYFSLNQNRKRVLRSERKTSWAFLGHTGQLSMEIEYNMKGKEKRDHHIVTQFVAADSTYAVGFCTLSLVALGTASLGLKTSSSFASADCVKSGTENRPPPVLVVFSRAVDSVAGVSSIVEETPCAKSKAEVDPPTVLVVVSCVTFSLVWDSSVAKETPREASTVLSFADSLARPSSAPLVRATGWPSVSGSTGAEEEGISRSGRDFLFGSCRSDGPMSE
jgi:hypothetical protein